MPRAKRDSLTRAESMALADLPQTFEEIMTVVERDGRFLRLRKVARLDDKGFSPEEITAKLMKTGGNWTLDLVFFLMGLDQTGTRKEREQRRKEYLEALDEVRNGTLVDVDAQLKENQVGALRRMKEAFEAAVDPKDIFYMGEKMLKLSGVADSVEKHVYEVRLDEDSQKALQAMVKWKAPVGLLDSMVNPADVKPNHVYCGDCGFSSPCPACKEIKPVT